MDFLPCTEKHLPPHLQMEAAAQAVAENPANVPNVAAFASMKAGAAPLAPQHLALLVSRYWGQGGVALTVGFLESTPADLRDRILSHMNAWGAFSNVRFAWTQTSPQVRVSRGRGGYWSYLGTDVLQIPAGQPTMNLEAFTMQTPDSEFYRVVRHETGHTLGFPHEHLRRQLVGRLDRPRTVAYFLQNDGWSEAETVQQVLTPLDESSIRGTPDADQDSIMCYQLPGEITTDGQPINGGADIDASDRAFAAKLYPPMAPPPPSGPANVRQLADPVFAALLAQAAHRPLELVQLRHVKSLFDAYADAHP